jgi:purine-nucleoside phosphorylase
MRKEVEDAISFIKPNFFPLPKIALILGSGLGDFADKFNIFKKISTKQIPFFPQSTVHGHAGYLIFGTYLNTPVLALQGRTHFYEGYPMSKTTFIIEIFQELGIKMLIVTNAAGVINQNFKPGDLMLIKDHIHFMFNSPLRGLTNQHSTNLVSMSDAYSNDYHKKIIELAQNCNINLKSGTLFTTSGPTYETSSEVKMIRELGGDAGSMSTSGEVIASAHAGIKVIGISCLTNYATGMSKSKLSHEEVTETANAVKDKFIALLSKIIANNI